MTARRDFIKRSLICSAGLAIAGSSSYASITHQIFDATINIKKSAMKFGLVTYQWGKDWDLPLIISNCEKTGFEAVELRTQHAHGVEISLNSRQRAEVKSRFADSPVTCVGYGSNFEFHSPDRAILRNNIEQTKDYIKLCRDIGASGIKVKPNTLPANIPREQTITQIANSLNPCKYSTKSCSSCSTPPRT
ncbi:MAG TPA: TIM barrel protein [Daejeonella sp.]|nr:TIM barrel protein [Daejeonella sp.]